MTPWAKPAATAPRPTPEASGHDGATVARAEPELLDDGQEEVFARSAVERGVVKDPRALAPEDLARRPKSDLDLRRP
ncbi:MAG: hypothetical protein AB1942_14195 [Pseudomonadota bacterium]